MARGSNEPCFVVTRRIYVNDEQAAFLDQKMDICNKIYNTAVKHYKDIVASLYEDPRYKEALEALRASKDEEEGKVLMKAIGALMTEYKLNEYDIHAYVGYQKKQAFEKGVGINIVQKVGSALYKAVKKAVFSETEIHYRKYGQTDTFEEKSSKTGIVLDKENNKVTILKKVFLLKPVRKTDLYMQEAMTRPVRYCRVVRKPFKNGYHYFLQIVLSGEAPKKIELGKGKCGTDEGVSTVAYYNDEHADFQVLAPNIEKYEKMVKQAAQKHERRLRMANPDNYNEDGTVKKGVKKWKRTKGAKKALMELKHCYRLKSEHIKQSHGRLTNIIVSQCDTIVKEPMDFRALARRSKSAPQRSDKETVITNKNGEQKKIRKFKRKKRFGKSINRRAPGLFNQMLRDKTKRYGGDVVDVDKYQFKASQYDHVSRKPKKPSLSTRTKRIGKRLVQRDLYSSFLLYHAQDSINIDFDACKHTFRQFLKRQDSVVESIKQSGDKTKNFGLSDFLKQSS